MNVSNKWVIYLKSKKQKKIQTDDKIWYILYGVKLVSKSSIWFQAKSDNNFIRWLNSINSFWSLFWPKLGKMKFYIISDIQKYPYLFF